MPRNLLLIWTHEQRADSFPACGNSQVHAPSLDRLAAESFLFENAYCTQPVCTPSRATIMTGVWPHTHGCVDNKQPLPTVFPTLAEIVGPSHDTAYHGKWHLGDEVIPQRGFHDWVSIEDLYREFYSRPHHLDTLSDYHHFLVDAGFPPDCKPLVGRGNPGDTQRVFSRDFAAAMAEQYTKAAFLGDTASRYLRSRSGSSKPFVLSVNFLEPHMPFFGPLNAEYEPASVDVGPAFAQAPPDGHSLRHRVLAAEFYHQGCDGFTLRTPAQWRRVRANYRGLVTMVDHAVGRILQALDESGMADDTLVVYTSDHGEMMGDHALIGKSVFYEPAVKVPLMIRAPWLSQTGVHVPGRVSQIDLAPTILDLLDLPAPDHLQGISRGDVLRGQADLADNDIVVEWNESGGPRPPIGPFTGEQISRVHNARYRSLITHDAWKLNPSATDHHELFHLESDPHELHNLIHAPEHTQRTASMRHQLQAWQRHTGDDAALTLKRIHPRFARIDELSATVEWHTASPR